MEAASTLLFERALDEAKSVLTPQKDEYAVFAIEGLINLSKEVRRLQNCIDEITKKVN
jgi:hypothetical protein